jgi:MFS family permease
MSGQSSQVTTADTQSRFFYGWVIVAACTLMIGITYGLLYSYSVFFKPLIDHFRWNRETVSLVYSASMIIRGGIAIAIGWLADKYGPKRIIFFCGLMLGAGLILSGYIHALWQFFITYAVIEAVGLSGAFGVGTSLVSRWFIQRRGLALGIAAAGSGAGTLLLVPLAERLVNAYTWSGAFIICGAVGGGLMLVSACVLRQPPRTEVITLHDDVTGKSNTVLPDLSLAQSTRDIRMILLLLSYLTFFFGIQIVMVHIVNYATDKGISALAAAMIVSIIGLVSIGSRLLSGIGGEKFGLHNTMILTRAILVVSLVFLLFTRGLGTFYLFAVIFGLTYGAEIPQIPLYMSKYFGTKALATLLGLGMFVTAIGGALGPWVAGYIYDNTKSYQWAFIAGIIAGVISLAIIVILKRQNRSMKQ